MKRRLVFATIICVFSLSAFATPSTQLGDVIFLHPDGMSVSTWGAIRISTVGPDGRSEWDKLPAMAVYTGHMKDALGGTSNGGATTHAYGVKVPASSFGMSGKDPLVAASGKQMSILEEAKEAGKAIGLVQSGAITEPGTAAFIASVPNREDHHEIAKQVVMANLDVILAGGEKYLLPQGAKGKFGEGTRTDGLNLIEEAKKLGYEVVYTKKELAAVSKNTKKLFGVFAYDHTFHDQSEEALQQSNLPLYLESAPTVGEMTEAALKILSRHKNGFFLVSEEEGSDNFANKNNASGVLEAGKRADYTIGVIRRFIEKNPKTMMLMASDSEAGGLALSGGEPSKYPVGQALPPTDMNGAPIDGIAGAKSKPFIAPADKAGKALPYSISWATLSDVSGGILVRGTGLNSHLIKGTMDNTDIYKVMYQTLFGDEPRSKKK